MRVYSRAESNNAQSCKDTKRKNNANFPQRISSLSKLAHFLLVVKRKILFFHCHPLLQKDAENCFLKLLWREEPKSPLPKDIVYFRAGTLFDQVNENTLCFYSAPRVFYFLLITAAIKRGLFFFAEIYMTSLSKHRLARQVFE